MQEARPVDKTEDVSVASGDKCVMGRAWEISYFTIKNELKMILNEFSEIKGYVLCRCMFKLHSNTESVFINTTALPSSVNTFNTNDQSSSVTVLWCSDQEHIAVLRLRTVTGDVTTEAEKI